MPSPRLFRAGWTAGVLLLTVGLLMVPGHAAAEGAWLGVSLQDLDRDLRDALDLDRGVRGTVVNSVIDGSPADEAGLRSNDVITAVEGRDVRDFEDLVDILDDYDPGDEVGVTVLRGDRERTFEVRLGDRDDSPSDRSFFGHNRFFSGDAPMVIDLDDLRDGDWRSHFDGDMDVTVDEDDGRIEIIIAPKDGDKGERKVIILGDDDEGRGRGNRFFWHHDDDEDDDDEWSDRDRERERRHEERLHREQRRAERLHERERRRHEDMMRNHERRFSNDAAYLGVYTTAMGEQLAAFFGTSEGNGVLIEGVVDDSPAQSAGFRAGDVILRVNGDDIESPGDLMREIRDREAGEEVEVEILRDKKKRTIRVKLGEADDFGMLAPESLHPLRNLGHELHAELAPEIRALAPKLHHLKPELHELQDLHRELQRHLHEVLPRQEMRRINDDVQEEVRRALRDAHEALLESRRELQEHKHELDRLRRHHDDL